jgi:hypothetical protein
VLLNEGKIRPRTGHKGPAGQQRYSSTLSLNSAIDAGGLLIKPRSGRFTPGNEIGTPGIGDWVGPRNFLDAFGKSYSHRASIPGPSGP